MKKTILLPTLFFIGGIIGVWAQDKSYKTNERKETKVASQQLNQEKSEKLKYFFLEAQLQKQKENFGAAFDLLQYCLEIDPDASEVYYQLSVFYFSMREQEKGEASLKRAIDLSPQNYWYMQLLASHYETNPDADKAIELYEKMTAQFPERTENLQYLVTLYIRAQYYQDAIDALNRLELKEGKNEEISMEKVRLYRMLNQPKMAFEELRTLAKEYPYDIRYKLILGTLYLENDQPKKALKIFKQAKQDEPQNPEVIFRLASYYKSINNDSLYLQQLDSILYNPKGEMDLKIGVLAELVRNVDQGQRDTIEVTNRFEQLISESQEDSRLLRFYISYLIKIGAHNDTIIPQMSRVLEIDPEDNEIRDILVRVALSKNQYKQVIDLCQEGLHFAPEIVSYYYLKGHAHFKLKEYEEALKTFESGLKICSPTEADENIPGLTAANLYSAMGDVFYEMGNKEKAYAMYDSCLSYEYDNVVCLNNYAYYLSLDKKDLDKAEEMSYRTIKAEPNNKIYLDTYAWILFIKKRYQEAKNYMDKVLESDNSTNDSLSEEISAVVVEHAGDIYYKVGETERALLLWQRALEMNGSTSDALPRKIELKKYVE